MLEPKLRFVTLKAIKELTEDLNLTYELDDFQDWEYIVGKPIDIEKYINHYNIEIDEDKRFALMEIIIQATVDQPTIENFKKYSATVEKLLIENFQLHAYTIFYWSCFDNENIEDCWKITPNMRKLWKQLNIG